MNDSAYLLRTPSRLQPVFKLGLGLILGMVLMSATAQEEPQFVPVLTPEAAQIFADTPETSVQIPEVYELLNIVIAMANIEDFLPEGLSGDDFMIDKSTPYYEEVEAQFGAHRDHPLVTEVRATFQQLIESSNFLGLLIHRNQSLRYRFDEEGNLVPTDLYIPLREMSLPEFPELETLATSLPFDVDDPETLSQLADFAEQTDFRQFYAEHQNYYSAQTDLAADLCDAAAARDWLAAQFPAAYNSHAIVLSPLVGGTHNFFPVSTPDESVTQALMFVPIFGGEGESVSEVSVQDRAAYCRQIFTEIDHGYVNPATDLYVEEVEVAMPNYAPWNDEDKSGGYTSAYETFNEYMTFAAYALFLTETLPEADQEVAIQNVEEMMVDRRGFVKFPAFNQELLRLYQEREEGQTVTDLYPAVLGWVAAQN